MQLNLYSIKISTKIFDLFDPINVAKIITLCEANGVFLVIINSCFNKSSFTCFEKCDLLGPFLKNVGLDHEDLSDYGPVLKLSFLSELIEQDILVQLVEFLEENNIIPMLQSARSEYHSVETALCKIHNDLVHSVRRGRPSLILFDLSPAFNIINHENVYA